MAVKEQFAQECFDFFREVTEKQDFGSAMASYTSTCLTKEVVYLSTLFTTKFLGGQKEPFVNFKGTPRISNYNWRNIFVKLNWIWRHFRLAWFEEKWKLLHFTFMTNITWNHSISYCNLVSRNIFHLKKNFLFFHATIWKNVKFIDYSVEITKFYSHAFLTKISWKWTFY